MNSESLHWLNQGGLKVRSPVQGGGGGLLTVAGVSCT